MNYAKPLFVVASLTLAACSGTPGEVEDPVGSAQQAALAGNALAGNALAGNALAGNALAGNALAGNALAGNALAGNSLVIKDLEDPNAREVLKYMVSCALPADQSVTVTVQGTTYTYPGLLGLTPEWGEPDGSCDNDCQQWVSACLYARVDFLGVKREISLRGVNPALTLAPGEAVDYSVREATYFGNYFTAPWEPPQRYACLSPGQTVIDRVCGPTVEDLEDCVLEVDPWVTCNQVCEPPTADGAFQSCRPGDGSWWDQPYQGSITVYLEPGEP
jgi:hypothetical protein